jgi:hypothetical protein
LRQLSHSGSSLGDDQGTIAMMRDIRHDLRERLRTLEAQRDQLHANLKDAESQIAILMQMLEIEDRRYLEHSPSDIRKPTKKLNDFIYEELARRRMTKDEIKAVAERAGYEKVGRGVHLNLVNMEKSRRIRLGTDQKYEQQTRTDERSGTPFSSTFSGSH